MLLKAEASLEGHADRVWFVCWSPDGSQLASCSGDKTVRIWAKQRLAPASEVAEWHCVAVLEEAHTRTVRACSWSPNGRYLATASFDATTAIWECDAGSWEQVSEI
jgi:WD40 repeat protein